MITNGVAILGTPDKQERRNNETKVCDTRDHDTRDS